MATFLGAEIQLRASDKRLRGDLRRAERRWKDFSSKVGTELRRLGALGAAVGAAVVAGFTAAARASLRLADALAKGARNAGLAFDAYQKLKHGLELSGVKVTPEKVITQTTYAVGQAKDGLASYIRQFDKLNLNYRELALLSPEQQFYAVVEALRNVDEGTRKAAGQVILGGRVITQLGTVLNSSEKDLRAMGDELEYAGGLFDGAAASAERFNDDMATLTKVTLARFGNAFHAALGDGGQRVEWFRKWGEAVGKVTRILIDGAKWVYQYREQLWFLVKAFIAYKVVMVAFTVGGLMVSAVKAFHALAQVTKVVAAAKLRAAGATALLAGKMLAITAGVAALVVVGKQVYDTWDRLAEFFANIPRVLIATWRKFKADLAVVFQGIKTAALLLFEDLVKGALNAVNDAIDLLNKIPGIEIGRIGTSVDFTSDAIRAGLEAVAASRKAATDLAKAQANLLASGINAGSAFAEEMKGVWDGLVSFFQGLPDKARNALAPFLKMFEDFQNIGAKPPGSGSRPGEGRDVLAGVSNKAAWQPVAEGMVDGLTGALDSALRGGRWKDVADTFVSGLQNALIKSLTDRFRKFLTETVFGSIFTAHTGLLAGPVPGSPGEEVPALLRGGEWVLTEQQFNALARGRSPMRGDGSRVPNVTQNNYLWGDPTRRTRRIMRHSRDDLVDSLMDYERENGRVLG